MTAPDRVLAPDSPFAPVTLVAPDGARATVLPYGAHVVGWMPAPTAPGGAVERLFVSARSEYREGAAVRGGVPVIFPQFSDRVAGPGPSIRHGFARTRPWRRVRPARAPSADTDVAEAVFTLADDETTRARWPHAFRAELTVRVAGAVLDLALAVENPGPDALLFTGALHTYLRVEDIATARVLGLETVAGQDNGAGGAPLAPAGAPLTFGDEVDRLYLDVPTPVTLDDPAHGRALQVAARGFGDVVVWNPGPVRAAALADLEPEGWRRYVCVEAVAARPVTVQPGARWEGAQRLTCASQDAVPSRVAR